MNVRVWSVPNANFRSQSSTNDRWPVQPSIARYTMTIGGTCQDHCLYNSVFRFVMWVKL